MNEFARFVADLNRNLDQVLYTVDRMQSLYRSFRRISPLLEPFAQMLWRPVTTSAAGKKARAGTRRRKPDGRRRRRGVGHAVGRQ